MSIAQALTQGDDAAFRLLEAIRKARGRLSGSAAAMVAELETDARGRVLPNAANIARIDTILEGLRSEFLLDDGITDAVADYVESLNSVAGTVLDVFMGFDADRDVLGAITTRTKASVASELLDAASYRDTWTAIADVLTTGIVTGGDLSSIAKAVAWAAEGSKVDASTERLVRSTPSIMQRAQTVAAAEAGGVEFYLFQGRPIATTREWCREREGRIWHVEEIREWGRQAAAGDGWDGMVEGTDERTIFTYLGGWYGDRNSCRHVLVPVLRKNVPPEDIVRMVSKGLW